MGENTGYTIRALGINGSPVKDGNCDILVRKVLEGSAAAMGRTRLYNLNELTIKPCQSCGKSPYPDYCFFDDSMNEIYEELAKSDLVVFASPIYFDTVSAQAKLLIDRCNCLRPPIFSNDGIKSDIHFLDRDLKPKKGVIILSGGKRRKFECARMIIKGFFKWANIEFMEEIDIRNSWEKGSVRKMSDVLDMAFRIGFELSKG